MAKFDIAIESVLDFEGRKFEDNPEIIDQPTNSGIIQADLDQAIDDNIVSHGTTLRLINQDKIKEIYKYYYWEKSGIDLIQDQDLANKVFNCCVNMGIKTGIKMLQRCLMSIPNKIEVEVDGICGEETLKSVNESDASYLLTAIKSSMCERYVNIAIRNPSKQMYMSGWLKRAFA